METGDVFADAYDRIHGVTHRAVEGLTPEVLSFRVDPDANSIAWLVWHLTRIQDDHVAGVAGTEQIWTSAGWYERFGLPFPPSAIGYGFSSDDVAAVQVGSVDLLLGYFDAVHEHTLSYVQTLTPTRPRPDRRRVVGPARDPRRPSGERHLRQPAARGPGGVRPRHRRAPIRLKAPRYQATAPSSRSFVTSSAS